MKSYEEYEHGYDFYLALRRVLSHDGTPCDARPGAYIYVADGPRVILAVDQHGNIGVDDYGGPITGGWTSGSRQAFEGGTDGIRAQAAQQEARLRRWQRKTGRKHP